MRKKLSGSRRAFQIRFFLISCVCALIELYIVGAAKKARRSTHPKEMWDVKLAFGSLFLYRFPSV
jgi:hypothetical protein